MKIYNFLAQLYYNIRFLRNAILSSFIRLTPENVKKIPIIINNRNRLTFLKMLVERLESMGYHNIIILDNCSTYPPLLEYYKITNCEVIYLDKNYGYAALQEIPLYQQVRKKFYVYTDPDVVPSEICPDDFMNVFYQVLKKYPFIQKVGFSLKINDLPDHFEAKEKVIEWESQFYVKEKEPNHYIADIDTTFALHRPYSLISVNARIMNKHLRMGPPFEAYHMPWYNNTSNLSEEEKYYIKHVEIGTHWSKGLGQENIIKDFPLKRMIKKIMGIRHE